MKKFISASLVLGLIAILAGTVAPAFAHGDNNENEDECNEETTYTKSSDYSNSKVTINFENSDEQIDVSAGSGYAVVKVELDVEDDGHGGFYTYATGPVDNFNPSPGGDIDEAKVTVKKVCETPTPTPTEEVTPTPTEVPQNPGNPGGPGDGRSDGRSDGGSSCPSCTQAPQGQVLGASTDFAGTGVADELLMNAVGVMGSISTIGGLLIAKKRS